MFISHSTRIRFHQGLVNFMEEVNESCRSPGHGVLHLSTVNRIMVHQNKCAVDDSRKDFTHISTETDRSEINAFTTASLPAKAAFDCVHDIQQQGVDAEVVDLEIDLVEQEFKVDNEIKPSKNQHIVKKTSEKTKVKREEKQIVERTVLVVSQNKIDSPGERRDQLCSFKYKAFSDPTPSAFRKDCLIRVNRIDRDESFDGGMSSAKHVGIFEASFGDSSQIDIESMFVYMPDGISIDLFDAANRDQIANDNMFYKCIFKSASQRYLKAVLTVVQENLEWCGLGLGESQDHLKGFLIPLEHMFKFLMDYETGVRIRDALGIPNLLSNIESELFGILNVKSQRNPRESFSSIEEKQALLAVSMVCGAIEIYVRFKDFDKKDGVLKSIICGLCPSCNVSLFVPCESYQERIERVNAFSAVYGDMANARLKNEQYQMLLERLSVFLRTTSSCLAQTLSEEIIILAGTKQEPNMPPVNILKFLCPPKMGSADLKRNIEEIIFCTINSIVQASSIINTRIISNTR